MATRGIAVVGCESFSLAVVAGRGLFGYIANDALRFSILWGG